MRVADGTNAPAYSPYEAILGDRFVCLAAGVRRAHLPPIAAGGILDVEHGTHWLVPLLIRLLSLPAAGHGQPVRLEVTSGGEALHWMRRIGPSVLRTQQSAAGTVLEERDGIGRIGFTLDVADGSLLYRQAWIGVGGVRLPPAIGPRVEARVSPAGEGWRVEVTVSWRGHLVCRYGGVLQLV